MGFFFLNVFSRLFAGFRGGDVMHGAHLKLTEPIGSDATLTEAFDRMIRLRCRALPARSPRVSGLGIVTDRAVLRVPRAFWETTKVKDVMEIEPGTLVAHLQPLPNLSPQKGLEPEQLAS